MFNQQDNESEQHEPSIKNSENMYQKDQEGKSNFIQTNIRQGNQDQAASSSSQISQKSASTNVTTNSQNSREGTDEPSGLSQQFKSKNTQSTIEVMDVDKPKGGSPPTSKSQVVTPCEPKSKSQK